MEHICHLSLTATSRCWLFEALSSAFQRAKYRCWSSLIFGYLDPIWTLHDAKRFANLNKDNAKIYHTRHVHLCPLQSDE